MENFPLLIGFELLKISCLTNRKRLLAIFTRNFVKMESVELGLCPSLSAKGLHGSDCCSDALFGV